MCNSICNKNNTIVLLRVIFEIYVTRWDFIFHFFQLNVIFEDDKHWMLVSK